MLPKEELHWADKVGALFIKLEHRHGGTISTG